MLESSCTTLQQCSAGLPCVRPCRNAGVASCLQVVVDTAEAGKALLARGRLRSRVTLIPLDNVRPWACQGLRFCNPLHAAGSSSPAQHARLCLSGCMPHDHAVSCEMDSLTSPTSSTPC
jgi:hypothetical protein